MLYDLTVSNFLLSRKLVTSYRCTNLARTGASMDDDIIEKILLAALKRPVGLDGRQAPWAAKLVQNSTAAIMINSILEQPSSADIGSTDTQ